MKRILRSSNFVNSLWNLMDVVIYPVVFLAMTPFFIRRLGEEEFGLWMLVNSVLVTFQLMNFGLGSATQRNVARFRGRNSIRQVTASINTNLSLALILILLCLLAGFILFFSIRQFNLFQLDEALKDKASMLMILASILVALKFIEQILQHALKGYEDFKTPSRIHLGVRFSILLANIALVVSGYTLLPMFISQITISLLFLVVYLSQVKRVIPGYRLYLRWNRSRVKEELRYALHTWVQSVAVILTYHMDRFIVTSFFGLAVLSYYSLVATMFNHIHMCINALIPWMLPKVARLREKGAEVVNYFLSARAFIIITGTLLLLLFYGVSRPLLTLWLGAEMYGEIDSYMQLFVLFELFFLFTSASYFFLNANGNEKLMTRITLTTSVITVAAMFSGIALFDTAEGMLYGLICGTALGIALANTVINSHILHQNPLKESLLILLPSTFAALVVIGQNPWLDLLYLAGVFVSAYLIFVRSREFNLKVLLFG